jgi:TLC domain
MESLADKYLPTTSIILGKIADIIRQFELSRHGLFNPPPPAFLKAVTPICEYFGFKALALHLHVILGAAILYQIIFLLSPLISSPLKSYTNLKTRSKINWDLHLVSMVQSLLICWLAYLALGDPKLKEDRVFGYAPFGADVSALACGYFVWDSYVSVKYAKFFGIGFALHGLASLAVFIFGFVFPFRYLVDLATFSYVLWTCRVIL